LAFVADSAFFAPRSFIYAMIFAVWIRVEVTALCLHWVSFSTFEAHAIPALVMELIVQAAVRLIWCRVASQSAQSVASKTPRKFGVGSSSAGGNSEKSGGENGLH
jgi:hypothetical protein